MKTGIIILLLSVKSFGACIEGFACNDHEIKKKELLTTICSMYNNLTPEQKKTDQDWIDINTYYPRWYDGKKFEYKDCPKDMIRGGVM